MTGVRRSVAVLLAVVGALLALPAAAGAHAALLRTVPSASGVVNGSPARVSLTYSEAVEPRFAIVSVTDASGRLQTAGSPRRSPANADQLDVPLKSLAKGWYLVYWRVISADGHPVRGAFTFAVGPNPGPAPQFVIPSLRETAATIPLLISRLAVFLSVMAAVGLLAFRLVIVRPLGKRFADVSTRPVNVAFAVASAVALIAIPYYVLQATAEFALRSVTDLSALIPLARASAFGRGYLDLELVFALFAFAGAAAIYLDRPDRPSRSIAELLAGVGALLGAAAVLVMPGLAGHAAQTSPRGEAVALDWVHLVAGSIWIGGLIGLTVLAARLLPKRRVGALGVVVPRFSRVAFVSVMAIIASGTLAALTRLPTLSSLWDTGYGQALVVKIGFLIAAMMVAAVNLLRTRPRLMAADARPELGPPAATLLRRLVGAEVLLVLSAIFVAGVLSSLPPPSKALGRIGKAAASIGPGPVARTVNHGKYKLNFQINPNKAAVPNAFAVRVTRNGQPVSGANVESTFTMLDMDMGQLAYRLDQNRPGVYSRSAPSLVMVGHWALSFTITPPGETPFDVLLLDRAGG